MKNLSLFVILIALIGCSQSVDPVNFGLLEERDGVYYNRETNEVFTGSVFNIPGTSVNKGYINNGKFHGEFSSYYGNDQLRSTLNYVDGVKEGEFVDYFSNGQISRRGFFKQDELHGQFEEFTWEGRTLTSAKYNLGQPTEEIKYQYFENGDLYFVENYKNGLLDGLVEEFHENGNIFIEETFSKGKRDGISRFYFTSGNLQSESQYKNGKRNGYMKSFSESGELVKEKNYIDGKEIKSD